MNDHPALNAVPPVTEPHKKRAEVYLVDGDIHIADVGRKLFDFNFTGLLRKAGEALRSGGRRRRRIGIVR